MTADEAEERMTDDKVLVAFTAEFGSEPNTRDFGYSIWHYKLEGYRAGFAAATCPYIVNTEEGSSYCSLADAPQVKDIEYKRVASIEESAGIETDLLRRVYEAARRALRFDGIDKARAEAAVDDLDDAIEQVKLFDGGNFETLFDTTEEKL